jgi:hypothetical protein
MTDRLNSGDVPKGGKQCPPDMPRGSSDADKAARVRYWLDRGNAALAADGRTDLTWAHSNGHYFITSREAYLAERRYQAIQVPSKRAA